MGNSGGKVLSGLSGSSNSSADRAVLNNHFNIFSGLSAGELKFLKINFYIF